MSRKRNRMSRLTRTDVNTICEMQRKIDAYEDYICAMCGIIQRKDLGFKPILMQKGTPMDKWMNISWIGVQEMKKEIAKLDECIDNLLKADES